GDQDALASQSVMRRQLRAQRWIRDLTVHMTARRALRKPHHPWIDGEAVHEHLATEVDTEAAQLLGEWKIPGEPSIDGVQVAVAMRQHPRCRALEDGEPRHLRLHLGNQLDRRRAGADDGDALAGDLMLVLPACRVEQRAGERIDARNVREARLAERPG